MQHMLCGDKMSLCIQGNVDAICALAWFTCYTVFQLSTNLSSLVGPPEALEDTLTSSQELTDVTILSVANYTLNDEAGRAEEITGIESKFYSLSKYQLIAYASIFTIELVRGRTEVFSLLFLLPIGESSEFLARFTLCEVSVHKLLQEFFLGPLRESQVCVCVCVCLGKRLFRSLNFFAYCCDMCECASGCTYMLIHTCSTEFL